MPSRILPSTNLNKYSLNAESMKFAKYFFLNNYEVKHIYEIFTELSKNKTTPQKFRSNFLLYIHYPNIPLMGHLFSIFEYNSLGWNSFFQLVMFFSFAPSVAIFYFLIHSIGPNQSEVSFYKLTNILDLLMTLPYFQNLHGELFYKYDLNNDSNLSFNQFCNFASQVNELWDPISILRMNMMKYIWNLQSCTNERDYYKIIMNRRKNIIEIKEYQSHHNSRLPSMSCSNTLKSFFNRIPNPMKYNYGCDNLNEVSFSELTNIMIRKYNKEYSYNKKELFAIKYLNSFNIYPMISEIDSYYVQYRSMLLQYNQCESNNVKKLRSRGRSNRKSISSCLSDNNNNNNNNNNTRDVNINIISPVSILRMARTTTSQSNLTLSSNRRPFSIIKESDYKKSNNITTPPTATTSPTADMEETGKETYEMPTNVNSVNYGSVNNDLLSTQLSDIVIKNSFISPKGFGTYSNKYNNQSNMAVPLYSMIPEDSELVRSQSCD